MAVGPQRFDKFWPAAVEPKAGHGKPRLRTFFFGGGPASEAVVPERVADGERPRLETLLLCRRDVRARGRVAGPFGHCQRHREEVSSSGSGNSSL